ncbi:hypothetical protein EKE94_00735 [Mesobaculum littorinae]|uniref:Uncharacterized protein n=1 Tax=Mesobaculum littorinae TaxID=2486419 RepID=A0A438AL03_9RHOB|nr:hypothetical protein [Mesobaculum littorinae]RVV99257.1 hypothetical protein EKE94_00735 [Mesobaculum littorinae]
MTPIRMLLATAALTIPLTAPLAAQQTATIDLPRGVSTDMVMGTTNRYGISTGIETPDLTGAQVLSSDGTVLGTVTQTGDASLTFTAEPGAGLAADTVTVTGQTETEDGAIVLPITLQQVTEAVAAQTGG